MLTFVIPSWNRDDKLTRCLDSIIEQIKDDSIKIAVYDDCSDDGTPETLKAYKEAYPNIVNYKRGAVHIDISDSFYNAFSMPETKWTWIMGDDDMLAPNALSTVLNIIKDDKFSFVHGAETTRSSNSRAIYAGTLLDLSNTIGFLEMTGFMSCNIIRTDLLQKGYKSKNIEIYNKCSFPHSLAMLEVLANKHCAFIDIPIVELQDKQQTQESLRRWNLGNLGMRYNYVGEGLRVLADDGIIPKKLTDEFFRYLQGNLFGKVLFTFWAVCSQTGKQVDDKDWEALFSMTEFLSDESRKFMAEAILEYRSKLDNYADLLTKNTTCLQEIDSTLKKAVPLTYPENYL